MTNRPHLALVTTPPDPLAEKRAGLMQRVMSRVPERLDRVEYPRGHVWQRRDHERVVLAVKRAAGVGEGVRG